MQTRRWVLFDVQKQGWTKNGAALANVVACLLRYGTGLGLGPDSDGLLNLGDVAAAEWGEVAAAASRRRLFDVNALLDSGGCWGLQGGFAGLDLAARRGAAWSAARCARKAPLPR
jgi:hypothetical protein